MRKLESAIIATILILCGQPVHAGVIISETEVQSGLGDSTTINKTVYVQGKKQKIETSHDENIIDLEKGVLYKIDPHRKSYVRIAFPPKMEREVAGASVKLSAVALNKTGRSRSIDHVSERWLKEACPGSKSKIRGNTAYQLPVKRSQTKLRWQVVQNR